MTSIAQARAAIYQQFYDGWRAQAGAAGYTEVADGFELVEAPNGGGLFLTPYVFDNEDFDPLDETPWVRLSVRHLSRKQHTIGQAGSRIFVARGLAFIQYFHPVGTGAGLADPYLEKAVSIFEGKRINSGVKVLSADPREGGADRDKRWWMATVEILFEYDEHK